MARPRITCWWCFNSHVVSLFKPFFNFLPLKPLLNENNWTKTTLSATAWIFQYSKHTVVNWLPITKIPLPTPPPPPPGDRFSGTPSKVITDILQYLPAKFGACTRFVTISVIFDPKRPDHVWLLWSFAEFSRSFYPPGFRSPWKTKLKMQPHAG